MNELGCQHLAQVGGDDGRAGSSAADSPYSICGARTLGSAASSPTQQLEELAAATHGTADGAMEPPSAERATL